MDTTATQDCIHLTLGEIVTLQFQDGSTVDVPRDVMAESTLFGDSLSDRVQGDESTLGSPSGKAKTWLQCVDLILDSEPRVLQLVTVCPASQLEVNTDSRHTTSKIIICRGFVIYFYSRGSHTYSRQHPDDRAFSSFLWASSVPWAQVTENTSL